MGSAQNAAKFIVSSAPTTHRALTVSARCHPNCVDDGRCDRETSKGVVCIGSAPLLTRVCLETWPKTRA